MNKELESRLNRIESALDTALSTEFSEQWRNSSFGKLSPSVTTEHINCLVRPNRNLIALGGKRWRPLLLVLCYQLAAENKKEVPVGENDIFSLTPLVEFVHTASLIHDDIEDSAEWRRGKPAAHKIYGIDTAINSASWLYFEAPVCINNQAFSDSLKLRLFEIYTEELRRLHLGQAMDISWHREPTLFPKTDEYMEMVRCKTGTLASLAAKTGFTAGGADKNECDRIGEIVAEIGIGFQIIDDVINLTTGNSGKKRGDDIVEGKKSLPVLRHIEEFPGDKAVISELMEKAAEEGIESSAVEECISVLEKGNCIKSAAEEGIRLIRKNCGEIANFYPGNSGGIPELIEQLFTSMIPENFL